MMDRTTHYIYIPGLGDRFDSLRRFTLLGWRKHNAHATLVPMNWSNETESYEQKYSRVADVIRVSKDERIVLVGESAGAAMALLALSRHSEEVSHVVTVCGYNKGAADIHQAYRRRNPAFQPLSFESEKVVRLFTPSTLQRITTVYSALDTVVTVKYTRLDGTKSKVMYTPGHFFTIACVLVLGIRKLHA